jgi:hypothetical protein
MPHRTNPFQHLILKLEQAFAGPGERVLESVELEEYPDSSLREIDTLIEGQVAGHPIRVAVECRDHARPQGKEWIDQLCGKYRDLNVSEVVAVSRSGFTRGAREKAKKVGIRLYTLEETEDSDWPESVLCCFVRLLSHSHDIVNAWVEFEPAIKISDRPEVALFVGGKSVGRLSSWLQGLYERDNGAGVLEYLNEVAAEFLEDGSDRSFCILIPFEGTDASIRTIAEETFVIRRITFCVQVDVRIIPVDTKRYMYRGNPVVLGSFRGIDKVFSIGVVHSPAPGALKVAFQEVTGIQEVARHSEEV